MFGALARRVFGTANDRIIKRFEKDVQEINALEADLEKLSDDDLRGQTEIFRERLKNGDSLDKIRNEAFAVVREASKRTLGLRHFDVQHMGGMVLHDGKIAEMKTGEGKTLVATLAVYLNALEGKGVHVVTVNDYLAHRDSAWMNQIYSFLGLTTGCITHGLNDEERRHAYHCDVTYGTNNEFGFDFLRDNMKFRLEDMVQRDFNFAIVDEVDSILIDEARTPLIISGPAEDAAELYRAINALIPSLTEEDFEKDEKNRAVSFTEQGAEHMESLLEQNGLLDQGGLYDIQNITMVHHANQALRAHTLFKRDTDYIVKDGKVIIIDEFTGRMMEGRRYSEGLHQALEAKENVEIQNENQTLASITFQNYFRMYPKLSGMTGTAITEAEEFAEIYKLEVVEMPTNQPVTRLDHDDEVYRTEAEKHEAIIDTIEEARNRRQPVLVGTVSIEKSELLSSLLKKRKIPHQVLNARFHEQEAHIIAQAGAPGAVTIATNMAGRGTDIKLGGNLDMRLATELSNVKNEKDLERRTQLIADEITENQKTVLDGGGLYVIGTERHESRRIDNQLRGRSGRQGDAGASKFFLSLEDDLMRIFGSERMDGMLRRLGLEEGEAIVHPWINKALEKAQQKVEARNFDIRKQLLKFDDVMNDQRQVIYEQRKELMRTNDVSETVKEMRTEVIQDLVQRCIPTNAYPEQWDTDQLHTEAVRLFNMDIPIKDWAAEEGIADQEILERLMDAVDRKMAEKVANYGKDIMLLAEKSILLQILDQIWKEHLLQLDHLRQGINLRAYAQRDPLNEYKREAFDMFETMLQRVREQTVAALCHVEIRVPEAESVSALPERKPQRMQESRVDPATTQQRAAQKETNTSPSRPLSNAPASQIDPNDPSTWGKVARNALCPCGSGKKYKHCHGKTG